MHLERNFQFIPLCIYIFFLFVNEQIVMIIYIMYIPQYRKLIYVKIFIMDMFTRRLYRIVYNALFSSTGIQLVQVHDYVY